MKFSIYNSLYLFLHFTICAQKISVSYSKDVLCFWHPGLFTEVLSSEGHFIKNKDQLSHGCRITELL
jgi:hypothetical protein